MTSLKRWQDNKLPIPPVKRQARKLAVMLRPEYREHLWG